MKRHYKTGLNRIQNLIKACMHAAPSVYIAYLNDEND